MYVKYYYKNILDNDITQFEKEDITKIININDIIKTNYSQYRKKRKEKKDIESIIDILYKYSDDEIKDIFNQLMIINEKLKHISHSVYILLTKRDNIINKNNKSVIKKIPTSGEKIIIDILNILKLQNKIHYYEWDKVLPIKLKNNLRADLFIIDRTFNYYIIEYDGIQHNNYIPFFHHDKNGFNVSKQRDKLKDKYCADNNIKILHINDHYDNKQIESSILHFLHLSSKF